MIGAGFASLAFALSQNKTQPLTLMEAGAVVDADPLDRHLVLSAPNLAFLKKLGIEGVAQVCVEKVRVREQAWPRQLRFNAHDTRLRTLGASVSAHHLLRSMRAALAARPVETIQRCKIEKITYDQHSAKPFTVFTNQGTRSFAQVVQAGSDAKLLASIGVPIKDGGIAHLVIARLEGAQGVGQNEAFLSLGTLASLAVVPSVGWRPPVNCAPPRYPRYPRPDSVAAGHGDCACKIY